MVARRGGLLIQTCLLVLGCSSLPGDATSRYLLVRQARARLEMGEPKAAQKLLQKVVKSEPRAEAWFNLGWAQRAAGRQEQAARSWRTALELDPALVPALYHLAELRRDDADREGARELLQRAAAVDAHNAAVQRLLADTCASLGDSAAAIAARGEAERLDPERGGAAPSIFGLGSLLLPRLRSLPRLTRSPPRFAAESLGQAATAAIPLGNAAVLLRGNNVLMRPEQRRWTQTPLVDAPVLMGCAGLFDADGEVDLLACTRAADVGAPTRLWLLRQNRAAALLDIAAPVQALCPLDADADGDLDLVLAVDDAAAGLLWCRNDGSGRFGAAEPLPGQTGFGPAFGITAADLDGDARLDLVCLDAYRRVHVLVARENAPFVALAMLSGLTGQRARALACADLDADGDMDLLLGDDEGLWVWSNEGAARFVRTAANREALSGWTTTRPRGVAVAAIHVADLDNDGLVDVVSQHFTPAPPVFAHDGAGTTNEDASPASRRIEAMLPLPAASRLAVWHNEGNGLVADVTEKSGDVMGAVTVLGVGSGDFDADGDLDLVGAGADSILVVFWNEGGTVQRRLELELVDPARPAACFGARVEVHTGARAVVSEVHGTTAWLGVGEATQADLVRVVWPDGSFQNHLDVPLPTDGRLRVERLRH